MTTWDNETLTHHRCEACQVVTGYQWPVGFKEALAGGPYYTQCSKCYRVIVHEGQRPAKWKLNNQGSLVPMQQSPFFRELKQYNLPTRAADKYDSIQEFWERSISYQANLELMGAMLDKLKDKGCNVYHHEAVRFAKFLAMKSVDYVDSFEMFERIRIYVQLMDEWLASNGQNEPPWGENPIWQFSGNQYSNGGQLGYNCIRVIQQPSMIAVAAQGFHELCANRMVPPNLRTTDGEAIAAYVKINEWVLAAIRQSFPNITPIWATFKLTY